MTNIYVTGSYRSQAQIAGTSLVNNYDGNPASGMFLAKYDRFGNGIWARGIASSNNSDGASLAADALGNIYVAGLFQGRANFGGTTLTATTSGSTAYSDVFLAKYNSAGTVLWVRQGSGLGYKYSRSVAVGGDGSVHWIGEIGGNVNFGVASLAGTYFHAKYDSSGNLQWARSLPADVKCVAVSPTGESYQAGQLGGGVTDFGGVLVTNATGYPIMFVLKLDAGGTAVWVSQTAGGFAIGRSIALDDQQNFHVAGSIGAAPVTFGTTILTNLSDDAFVCKGNSSGSFLWSLRAGGPGNDYGFSVSVDDSQNVYLGGTFTGTNTLGSTYFVGNGGSDIFIAKFDSAGNTIWAKGAGFIYDEYLNAMALDRSTNIYVTGNFNGATIRFDSTNVVSSGVSDLYVAKLLGTYTFPPVIAVQPVSVTVAVGSNAAFSVVASSTVPMTYQWRFNGTNIAVGTNASLNLTNVQPADGGGYSVVVSNLGGSITSVLATLTAGSPPSFTAPPQSQIVVAGTNTSFTVVAGGTPPLSYQWQFNGANVAGATNSSLAISNAQPANGGNYIVVVTNAHGAATSTVATLTVRFALVVNITGGGSVTRAPNLTLYPPNSSVTLTATPNAGFAFNFWTGDAGGSGNPLGLTMTSNKIITANFISTALAIVIQGQGLVGKSPDLPFYTVGNQVTLSATPGRWFRFTGWGDGPTANPRLVTIGVSNSYTAIFSPTTAVETLTFSNVSRLAPVGMPAIFVDGEFVPAGTVARMGSAEIAMLTTYPNGSIFFTLDGSEPSFTAMLYDGPFEFHQSVTVRAMAYDASFLNSWEADPVTVSIQPTFAVNATTPGGGSIALFPTSGTYSNGALVTLTATPLPGWTFLQWLGDASGTNPSNTVRVTRDMCVQALFGTSLGTTVAGSGSVLDDPVAPLYPYGTVARLTGLPQAGNFFAAWGNAASSTNNPLLFPVTNANPTVSSVFGALSAGQAALTVVVSGQGRVSTSPRGNRFNTNQTVTLTATPDADQTFLGWSGDAGGLGTNLPVLMNQSKVITATFTSHPRFTLGPCLGGLREGGYQFTLLGNPGAHYQIDAAITLPNWTPLVTITNTFGVVQFMDASATNGVQRFYRARIVP